MTTTWAHLHLHTGLSLADFDELTVEDIEALQHALAQKQRHALRRDANLYALLCNLLGGGKKTFKSEDFLPENFDEAPVDPEEAAAVLAAYHAATSTPPE